VIAALVGKVWLSPKTSTLGYNRVLRTHFEIYCYNWSFGWALLGSHSTSSHPRNPIMGQT